MKSGAFERELKNWPKSDTEIERHAGSATHSTAGGRYIKWFREIGIEDVPIVGGKTASLGEMFRELKPKGVKVPDGFAITAAGYWHFLRETGIDQFIGTQLVDLDTKM